MSSTLNAYAYTTQNVGAGLASSLNAYGFVTQNVGYVPSTRPGLLHPAVGWGLPATVGAFDPPLPQDQDAYGFVTQNVGA